MYDREEIDALSTHAAIALIKNRADQHAARSGGIGALMAHLDGIWDAFSILAERVDALTESADEPVRKSA